MIPKPSDSDEPADPSSGETSPEKPKKKKHGLLRKSVWTIAGLVSIVVILVILAPTILSTSVARQLIVERINRSMLSGTLTIKDWSIGWRSGIRLQDLELSDANDEHLISAATIDVPVSLLKAAMGKIDLGKSTVSGVDFNAVIDPSGHLNILQAVNLQRWPAIHPSRRLRNIAGVIHFQQITGTVQDDPQRTTFQLAISGTIAASADASRHISAEGTMTLASFSAHGKPLKGDSFQLKDAALDLKASITPMDGKRAEFDFHLAIRGRSRLSATGDVVLDHVSRLPELVALVARSIFAENTGVAAIAGSGKINISFDLDAADLASQLPHLAHLDRGDRVTGGRLIENIMFTLTSAQPIIVRQMRLKDFTALRSGHLMHLEQVDARPDDAGLASFGVLIEKAMGKR